MVGKVDCRNEKTNHTFYDKLKSLKNNINLNIDIINS